MSSETILELKDVWKKYSLDVIFHRSLREDIMNFCNKSKIANELQKNDFWALQDVSFRLNAGQAIGIYGHNGAGKSTILKLVANVTYPTRGKVVVNGRIAPLIEIGAGFHPDLSGRDNIFVNGAILGMKIHEIRQKYESIVDFSELREFIELPVKKYSSGMFLRLAFSVAIHSEADIYLIDEILAVGDLEFQGKCLEKIRQLKKNGRTLVLISHDKQLLEMMSDKILLLEKGKIIQ